VSKPNSFWILLLLSVSQYERMVPGLRSPRRVAACHVLAQFEAEPWTPRRHQVAVMPFERGLDELRVHPVEALNRLHDEEVGAATATCAALRRR